MTTQRKQGFEDIRIILCVSFVSSPEVDEAVDEGLSPLPLVGPYPGEGQHAVQLRLHGQAAVDLLERRVLLEIFVRGALQGGCQCEQSVMSRRTKSRATSLDIRFL